MADSILFPARRLGKSPPVYDRRTLRLAQYIGPALPTPPASNNLSDLTLKDFPDLGMMLNDHLGCCTIAALGHAEETWSAYGGNPRRPSDDAIRAAYDRVNHGVDEGAAMLDVLKMARSVGIGGNPIYGFVGVNPLDHAHVKTVQWLFGGLYVGAMLPVTAQTQEIWDVSSGNGSEPGSWGGHAVNVVNYDPGGLTIVTWGQLKEVTWAWFDRYVDECYAILEEDYLTAGKSPQGIALDVLAEDLRAL